MSLQSTDVPWGQLRPNGTQRLVISAINARLLRGIFRRIARKALVVSGPSYDIEIDGVRLRCRLGDNATEYAILEYGPTAFRLGLPQVLAALRLGDTFVDAGANCGVFTAFGAKAVGPAGRVIAIEPQPEMLARLKFNVAANGLENVTVFATALGESAGTLPMRIKPHNLGAATLADVQDAPLRVPVTTLADVVGLAGVERIDLLKIDIEGYEDRALLPYIGSMPRALWPSRMFIELSRKWREDCVSALRSAGYTEEWSDGHDSMLRLA